MIYGTKVLEAARLSMSFACALSPSVQAILATFSAPGPRPTRPALLLGRDPATDVAG
jgi:hypothetical protein